MVTMLDNWLTLRMMSAPSGGDSNIVYDLYGHTCNGTAATAINTGIYLFDNTVFPYGWTIELDFYFTAHVSQGSVIRCRNAGSPYNGINTRNKTSSGQMEAQVNGVAASQNFSMGDRIKVFFDYTLPSNVCTVTVNNITKGTTSSNSNSMSGKTVKPPLVVGGENNNDTANFTWKSGRFPKCYITSLVVTKKTS